MENPATHSGDKFLDAAFMKLFGFLIATTSGKAFFHFLLMKKIKYIFSKLLCSLFNIIKALCLNKI